MSARRLRIDPRLAAAAVSIAVAIALGIRQLTRPGALLGLNEYDDGVYIAASIRLVRGVLPYQDFAFPHPPGIPLLLAPLAWLLRHASQRTLLGCTRILTIAVSVLNVALIAHILRRRHWVGVLAGSLAFAVFPLAVTANKAMLLEPYAVLFTLAGVALVFDGETWAVGRRAWMGWFLLGYGIVVKLWVVVPVVVLLVIAARSLRRTWKPTAAALALGAGLPALPFFLAAPSDFLRQVVVAQIDRGASRGSPSIGERFAYITGLRSYPQLPGGGPPAVLLVVLFVLAVGAAMFLRRRLTSLDWFALAGSVAVVTMLLASSDFFMHYGYFTAAFLALAGGCAVSACADAVGRTTSLSTTARQVGLAAMVAAIGVAGVVAVDRGFGVIRHTPGILTVGDPGLATEALLPPGACVVADEVSLLINANRLATQSGCPAMIDTFYEWLLALPERPPPTGPPYPEEFVARWKRWFEQADYVVLSEEAFRVPWTPELVAWFGATFTQMGSPFAAVYVRNSA